MSLVLFHDKLYTTPDGQEALSRGALSFGILPLKSGLFAVFDNRPGWNLIGIGPWDKVRTLIPAPDKLEWEELRNPLTKNEELINIDLNELFPE